MNLVSDFYRDREALRAAVRTLAASPNALCLDVGCKQGDVSRSFARTQRLVVALDIQRHPEWALPDPRLVFLNASAMALPFPDSTFDTVLSSECLQYVPDPELALLELARVLRPGGTLVVSFPEGNLLTNYLDPDNLSFCLRRLLRRPSAVGQSFVRFPRAAPMLRRAESVLTRRTWLRRGTIAYILISALIDQVQALRLRLERPGGLTARAARATLRPLLELLFALMNLDFSLAPPRLWYNNVLMFRKPEPPAP